MINTATKLIRTKRRTLSLEISDDLEIVVRAPRHINDRQVAEFVAKNEGWLNKRLLKKTADKKKLESFRHLLGKQPIDHRTASYSKIKELIEPLARKIGVRYKRFRVSNAKRRWGSCSAKASINLSWKLAYAPESVVRYVLIHELCHIRRLNHSKDFWKEVEKHEPDYKNCQKWLKENNYLLSV